ncbi:MAG: hypothetical protein CHACPFDD_03002 [Phycisphaerae bacterium]|nr:hypothetical protein [Phycisphaerae bacterium]
MSTAQPSTRGAWVAALMGPAFASLAAWFIWGPALTRLPVGKPAVVPDAALSTAARRTTVGDPPTILINNFRRTCTDCHRIFDVAARPEGDRLQHAHVKLEHGINDRCQNCHNYRNMNELVLYDGGAVTYSEAPRLCQKCHGLIFEDWERGIHGRVSGAWTSELGPVQRLRCIECHDPHQPRHPAMDPLQPLPGPATLRMGTPPAGGAHAPELREGDPLRRALLHPQLSGNNRTERAQHEKP